jgi:putative membrane protein
MGVITSLVGNIGALWGSPEASSALFWESLAVMAVFGVGAVVGILGFSKFLHWLLARWNKETLIVLAGFIIGSLVKVWPWNNIEGAGFPDLWGAIIFAVIGFSLVSGIEIAGRLIARRK